MSVTKSSPSHHASVAWLRLETAARQYGFVLMIVLLLAGFCGLFSQGMFSNAVSVSPDRALQVSYERFGRAQNDMDMKLTMTVPTGDSFTVTLSEPFMNAFEINALYPKPWRFSRHNGNVTLSFHDQPWGNSHTLWLNVQPRGVGKIASSLQVNNQKPVALTQIIFP